MASLRTACAIGVAVCCVFLITKPTLAEHFAKLQTDFGLQRSGQNKSPHETMEAIEDDAIREGGTIIRCGGPKHVCRDLEDNSEVGNARDGYYILFPKSSGYEEKMQRYQNRVRQWVDSQ